MVKYPKRLCKVKWSYGGQNINQYHAFKHFIKFLSVIDGAFYSAQGPHV